MTNQEIINGLLAADPASLREIFATLHGGFARKAEDLYDKNPEENGIIAQPYADLADVLHEASLVFEEPDGVLDATPDVEQDMPTTVSQAVEARVKNPWGGR